MASNLGMKRKRVVVNMEKKLEALHRLDMGETLKSISMEFGVGDSTVSDWKKNRKQIEAFCQRMACQDALRERKVVSRTKNDALDEALLLWMNQELERGVVITGSLIQEKALFFHKLMGGNDPFMASLGWLDRFKKRNGIRNFSLMGEGKLSGFVSRLGSLLEDLTPDQVYTSDQLVLKYRTLPGRLNENVEKVVVVLCCNASGTHKLPPLVIGSSPQCSEFDSLPVVYKSHRTSCMSESMLREWFEEEFVQSVRSHLQERILPEKATLLLDRGPPHMEMQNGDFRAVFFPHTVTVAVQPMQQGILKQMMLRCRRNLLSTLLRRHSDCLGGVNELLISLSEGDVVYVCSSAWDDMPVSVLVDAWKHCWNIQENVELDVKQEPGESDELDVASFVELVHQLPECEKLSEQEVQEWLDLDQGAVREFVCDVSHKEEKAPFPKISHEDGAKFLELALMYVEQQSTSMAEDVKVLKRLRDQAAVRRDTLLSQENIGLYLPKNCWIPGPT